MAEIDVTALSSEMLGAVTEVLKHKVPEVKAYSQTEFKKIAETIWLIQKQWALGEMTEEQARLHLEIQKNASRSILLTLEGIGLLTAEAAINAALKVVQKTVNTAIGFVLLV